MRDVRVLGAVGVIEVDHLPNLDQISKIILEHGVWLRPFGNWIYTMPPLITSNAEIVKIADAMKALARV